MSFLSVGELLHRALAENGVEDLDEEITSYLGAILEESMKSASSFELSEEWIEEQIGDLLEGYGLLAEQSAMKRLYSLLCKELQPHVDAERQRAKVRSERSSHLEAKLAEAARAEKAVSVTASSDSSKPLNEETMTIASDFAESKLVITGDSSEILRHKIELRSDTIGDDSLDSESRLQGHQSLRGKNTKKRGKRGGAPTGTSADAGQGGCMYIGEEQEIMIQSINGSRGRITNRTGTSNTVHMYEVSMEIQGQEFLCSATLLLKAGEKYGLIGRNGIGKSTVMKAIAKHEISGFPSHISTLLVEQEAHGSTTQTALQQILAADTMRTALLAERDRLLTEQAQDHVHGTEQAREDRLSIVFAQLELIEADTAEDRALKILRGLQFSNARLQLPTAQLSGGWRMRVALARALFLNPDILLLDEPTNHLDLPAVLWLQHYIQDYPGTIVCVSHDGDFLDHFATEIIHMHHGKLDYYPGNFSQFEKNRSDKIQKGVMMQKTLDNKRAHYEKSIEKMRKSAQSKRRNKEGDSKKLALMASRKKKLTKMGWDKTEDGKRWKYSEMGYRPGSIQEGGGHKLGFTYKEGLRCKRLLLEPSDPPVKFTFASSASAGSLVAEDHVPLVQLLGVGYRYATEKVSHKTTHKFLFSNVSLDIEPAARIGLLGRNGSGKSTLLRLLMGQLQPIEGKIQIQRGARVSLFAQHHVDALDMEHTPLEHMRQKVRDREREKHGLANVSDAQLRAKLGQFGLGKKSRQKIGTLSGGEKARLVFASVLTEEPNLLLLDEPTNHLDYDTITALMEAIDSFPGAIIMTSHHQSIMSTCCRVWWDIRDRGIVTTSFDQYLQQQLDYFQRHS